MSVAVIQSMTIPAGSPANELTRMPAIKLKALLRARERVRAQADALATAFSKSGIDPGKVLDEAIEDIQLIDAAIQEFGDEMHLSEPFATVLETSYAPRLYILGICVDTNWIGPHQNSIARATAGRINDQVEAWLKKRLK